MKSINAVKLRDLGPCENGLGYYLDKFGEKDVSCLAVLESLKEDVAFVKEKYNDNSLSWANWFIVRIMSRKQRLAYAIFAAEQVIEIFEGKYPKDDRPRKAIEAAKSVLRHDTKKNRDAATAAAADAAYAAEVAAHAYAYAATAAAADAAYAAEVAAHAYAATAAAARAAAAAAARSRMQLQIINYGISLLT